MSSRSRITVGANQYRRMADSETDRRVRDTLLALAEQSEQKLEGLTCKAASR